MHDFPNKPGYELWPLLERSSDGVVLVTGTPWRVVAANLTLAEWLATTPEQLVGRALDTLFGNGSSDVLTGRLEQIIAGEVSDEFQSVELAPAGGVSRPVAVRFNRVSIEGDALVGLVLRDRSTADAAARVDPLTGLPDRTFLNSRLAALLDSRRQAENFALLFVDINNFKEVNDRHGHLIGDQVLREAARQLEKCIGAGNLAVRYGGDEFVVLVEPPATSERIEALVSALTTTMSRPIAMPIGSVTLAVSVGIATGPGEFRTPEDVIAAADRAMYTAKRGE